MNTVSTAYHELWTAALALGNAAADLESLGMTEVGRQLREAIATVNDLRHDLEALATSEQMGR